MNYYNVKELLMSEEKKVIGLEFSINPNKREVSVVLTLSSVGFPLYSLRNLFDQIPFNSDLDGFQWKTYSEGELKKADISFTATLPEEKGEEKALDGETEEGVDAQD